MNYGIGRDQRTVKSDILRNNELNDIRSSEQKLKDLEKSIVGFGKEGYPFRHKNYELNTCVPCTDFSNWIIDRLEENDIWAIKLLEWEISKGSGIMVESSTTDNESNPKSKELNVYFWVLLCGSRSPIIEKR